VIQLCLVIFGVKMFLKELEPIHTRLAIYAMGDIDEVEHDCHYANKLDISLHSFMESRCMNTVNLVLQLFCQGQIPKTLSIESVQADARCNLFVFELCPSLNRCSEEVFTDSVSSSDDSEFIDTELLDSKPTHTWLLLRYGDSYLMLDSYASKYTLARKFVDITDHLEKCSKFLELPSSANWFDLIGVVEDIDCNYTLSINGYSSDLSVNALLSISDLCKLTLTKMKKNKNCIYHDDIMCLPLVDYRTLTEDTSASDVCMNILKSFIY